MASATTPGAVVGVLSALVLSLAGCSGGGPALTFEACPASMDAARAQVRPERAAVLEFGCASVSVPVVHENPSGAGAVPVVVVGTRHDPATPYAGAVSMTAVLGKATLVTYEGQGHTTMGRSACVDAYLTAFSWTGPCRRAGRAARPSRLFGLGRPSRTAEFGQHVTGQTSCVR